MSFRRIASHLLPRARAWRVTLDKTLRQYIAGLSEVGTGVQEFVDGVWLDLFPDTTRELAAWELEFGLPSTVLTTAERRARLDAAWKAIGGQSPRYIQDTLQAAGFDVYVHEWWVPGTTTPRDPTLYLSNGEATVQFLSCDGAADMQDGDAVAQDGATVGPSGYPLVNKVYASSTSVIGDGNLEMLDGGANAQDGDLQVAYNLKQYAVSSDPTLWPYFLYIGGATFPDKAVVDAARKNEFETLCLKICPTQQWLGILVDFT